MEVNAVFDVKVKTNAKKFRIRINGLTLLLDIRAIPREGEANKEIIKELKKFFKRDVEIVKGFKDKEKVIMVHNLMPQDAQKILQSCERVEEPTTK